MVEREFTDVDLHGAGFQARKIEQFGEQMVERFDAFLDMRDAIEADGIALVDSK